MGWRYQSFETGGENPGTQQKWVWVEGVPSQGYYTGGGESGDAIYNPPPPEPGGQVALGSTNYGEGGGGNDAVYVDPQSNAAYQDQSAAGAQYTQQLDAKFKAVINNPNASSWEKAMAVQERYGIEALAQAAGQGYFADIAGELGPHISAAQARVGDKGFTVGGNPLGLWPVLLGTGAFAGLAAAGAGAAGTTAGTGAAEGAGLAGAYGGFDAAAVAGADYGLGSAAAGATGTAAGGGLMNGAMVDGAVSGGGLNSALAAGGGTAGAGTALSRLLDGAATADDWLSLAGSIAPAALGAYASNEQSQDLAALSDKYFNVGAPSRARFEGSFAPGFTMANEPGYSDALDQTTKSFLHKASVTGNPADSPNAWMQTLKDVNNTFAMPQLNEYRRLNAGTGGLAALTSAAPGLDTQSVNAQRGIYDSIGSAAADIFTPRKSLSDLLREAGYA